jgi:hypothetical protein
VPAPDARSGGGYKHGSSFFESLSRALAIALVQRLVPVPSALLRDPRIERTVRLSDGISRKRFR